MRGREPTWADIARAAHANFRLVSDEQLKAGCGCQRSSAKQRLQRALAKAEQGKRPTHKEVQTLEYLGNWFIWKPAFTSAQLAAEFTEVLVRTGIIKPGDGDFSEEARTFLAPYALSLMHGSAIILEDGHRGRLFAGSANQQRHLEVKVEIVFSELSKPLMAPICLFLTDLSPEETCTPALLESSGPVLPSHWNFPLDLGPDGKLDRVG